ncbi:pheromone-regulated membrane protein [Nakaseomyces bracarensis]|uniref:Pheromone-regulated membrane protein n=1 Tax=Nakaseomyces bracarensis TaxID=273131 RepID=A0ABR4NLX3_9SACH
MVDFDFSAYEDLQFDDIDLDLFKSGSCTWVCKYIIVWVMTLMRVAVLVSDLYTCYKLIALNSWSNNIVQPIVPFKITKWLFSTCILISFVLWALDILVAIRLLRDSKARRSISRMYLNNCTRTYLSLRSFRLFCLFSRIEPASYFEKLSVWSYFEIKGAPRLLFGESPRQLINSMTLWSILVSKSGKLQNDYMNFGGIFHRIKLIALQNHEEAVLLSFMLFSVLVWSFFICKFCFLMIAAMWISYQLSHEPLKGQYYNLRSFVHHVVMRNINNMVIRRLESNVYDIESIWSTYTFVDDNRQTMLSTIYTPLEAHTKYC